MYKSLREAHDALQNRLGSGVHFHEHLVGWTEELGPEQFSYTLWAPGKRWSYNSVIPLKSVRILH